MFSKNMGIDIDASLILKNKIPILVRDPMWISLFGEIDDRTIDSLKKELKNILEEEQKVARHLNSLKTNKKKVMAKILNFSQVINNSNYNKDADILGDLQDEIHKINEDIEDATFKSEILPKEIREANLKLLKATIKYAYKDLQVKEKEIETTSKEIEVLREKLRISIDKKHNHEESVNNTYRFLHGILGGEEMERLDKNMF